MTFRLAVKFLPRAEKDLLELFSELQDEILHKAELLARFPEMGRTMEKAFEGYRFILAGKNSYRIIYQFKQSLVEIAYIRHCRRQLTLRLVEGE